MAAPEGSGSSSTDAGEGLILVGLLEELREYDWYPLRSILVEVFPGSKPHLLKDTFEPLANELVGQQWGDMSEALKKKSGYNNKEVYYGHWRLVREFALRRGKTDVAQALALIHGGAGASAVSGGPTPMQGEVPSQRQGLLGTPRGIQNQGMTGVGTQAGPGGQQQRVLRHDLSQLASALAQDPVIASVLPAVQQATRLHVHQYMEVCAFHGCDPIPIPQCQTAPFVFGQPAAPATPGPYTMHQACPMETDDVVDDVKPTPVEVVSSSKQVPLGEAGEEYGCGCATAIGYRGKGEDRHLVVSFGLENGPLTGTRITMLAVCDGHGGDTTVNKLQASLEAAYKTALEGMASVAPEGFEAELLRVVTDAYSRLDYVMDAEFGDMECGGSTAVVALIIRDSVYIFNLGDSIGLIYLRDGTYVRTRPHNFFRFDEAVRVAKAERISHGRIAGSLMGTRAFGDFHAKRKSDHRPPQLLTAPEILSFAVCDVDHLVLASDGILDRAQDDKRGWLASEDADFGAFAWEVRTAGAGNALQIAWEQRCGRQGLLLNGLASQVKSMLVEAKEGTARAAAEHLLHECRGPTKPDDITVVYLRLTAPLLATTSV